MLSPDDAVLTPGQAARILGVSSITVGRWARAGRITAVMTPGGQRRFRPDEVERIRTERTSCGKVSEMT